MFRYSGLCRHLEPGAWRAVLRRYRHLARKAKPSAEDHHYYPVLHWHSSMARMNCVPSLVQKISMHPRRLSFAFRMLQRPGPRPGRAFKRYLHFRLPLTRRLDLYVRHRIDIGILVTRSGVRHHIVGKPPNWNETQGISRRAIRYLRSDPPLL